MPRDDVKLYTDDEEYEEEGWKKCATCHALIISLCDMCDECHDKAKRLLLHSITHPADEQG